MKNPYIEFTYPGTNEEIFDLLQGRHFGWLELSGAKILGINEAEWLLSQPDEKLNKWLALTGQTVRLHTGTRFEDNVRRDAASLRKFAGWIAKELKVEIQFHNFPEGV